MENLIEQKKFMINQLQSIMKTKDDIFEEGLKEIESNHPIFFNRKNIYGDMVSIHEYFKITNNSGYKIKIYSDLDKDASIELQELFNKIYLGK